MLHADLCSKLPFAAPDPIGEHQRTLFPDGASFKNAVIVPEMLMKLKQGFGRLVRCESDTGVVALLDSRVRKAVLTAERFWRRCRIAGSRPAWRPWRSFSREKSQPDTLA